VSLTCRLVSLVRIMRRAPPVTLSRRRSDFSFRASVASFPGDTSDCPPILSFVTVLLFVLLGMSTSGAQQAMTPARPEVENEPLRPEWCRQLPRVEYRLLERVPLPDRWFEVYRIRPGVFAICEPHQYEEVISYLIVGSRRGLLFDTGLGIGNMRAIVSALTPLPFTVLNSHTHFDHIGGNWQFNEILALDIPFSRSNAAGASRDQVSDAVLPERFCSDMPPGFRPEKYSIRAFQASGYVKEGQSIDLGGRSLEVLLTPGHTPDSLCLLDRKNRILFVGDTFYPGPIYLYVPETDVAAYESSIDRLAALVPQLDMLLTSHNLPVSRPEMLLRLAQAFRQVRSGHAPFTVSGAQREYRFDGFSLLLTNK
jgi:glyoxylase-like metal-dependent hydrolase (beta-lactamase superfamily II)